MAITETARKNHDQLFPGHVSTLKVTDPELIEVLPSPSPGTRNPERLRENLAVASVMLTEDEVRDIGDTASTIRITGGRGTGCEVYG
jgi:hypothetical protein